MQQDLKQLIAGIIKSVDEINIYKNNIINVKKQANELEVKLDEKKITKSQLNVYLDKLTKGKTKDDFILLNEQKILNLLGQIDDNVTIIISSMSKKEEIKERASIYEEAKISIPKANAQYIKGLAKKRSKKKEIQIPDYTLYRTTRYGKISNLFMENLSIYLSDKYPGFFISMYKSLKSSGIPILSKTFVSMILFSSAIAFILSFLAFFLIFNSLSVISVINSLLLAVFFSCFIFIALFYYPNVLSNNRRRKIKNDLPFVIVHMAAVAGSGAQPIAMFNLILTSGEFKGVEGEIKKIVNYVNLFGYNLSTSLKLVALTTPSKEFREFLNGLVTTIETGGDLKEYLNAKANEAITTYRLDRKKYVASLSTYSDIYVGVLIAAPLLFFATLAIIQVLGGSIFGLTVNAISIVGTFVVIPLLNIFYLLFVNIMQPES
ncbi:type II secretion system F family protein [Candidatus Woesearchaeota archaeon]|nr:type II secretion system F family protein [Candidatus Woesearchaeota archaeon]